MTDVVGMSPEFNEQVKRTVRETLRRSRGPERTAGRWHKKGGSGGDHNAILFQIVSADSTTREAIGQIEARTFTGPAYDSFLDDTVVYVYDRMGCLFNEPNVDLTGRWGRAELFLMNSMMEAMFFPEGYPPEKIWIVTALCCPQTSCGS